VRFIAGCGVACGSDGGDDVLAVIEHADVLYLAVGSEENFICPHRHCFTVLPGAGYRSTRGGDGRKDAVVHVQHPHVSLEGGREEDFVAHYRRSKVLEIDRNSVACYRG